MHFAYPPRKSSNPPRFTARAKRIPLLRRRRVQTLVVVLLLLLGGFWFLADSDAGVGARYKERVPSGDPPVVIVTVLDPGIYSDDYLSAVKENRELYAKKHGYVALLPKASDYKLEGDPASWAQIMAARQALSEYPDCGHVWLLDQNSFIMDPTRSLQDQVLATKKLDALMMRDKRAVPPDSVIRTFAHLEASAANMVLSQDSAGLNTASVIVRNGDWAKFLLETWLDPLYRSYNFLKAERHSLEHMVQWHPTILAKMAVVPQSILGSYTNVIPSADQGEAFIAGDFVVVFNGCALNADNPCETQLDKYMTRWKEAFGIS